MNKPDLLELQGNIDAMRIVISFLIAEVPLKRRQLIAQLALKDAEEFQRERIPQMTHPVYLKALQDTLNELA